MNDSVMIFFLEWDGCGWGWSVYSLVHLKSSKVPYILCGIQKQTNKKNNNKKTKKTRPRLLSLLRFCEGYNKFYIAF